MRKWDKGIVLRVYYVRPGVLGAVYSSSIREYFGIKNFVRFHADHHCLLPMDEIMFGSNTLIHYRPSRHGPGPDYVYKLYRGDNEES